MKARNYSFLIISRCITYLSVFIISLISINKDIISSVTFIIFFAVLLINSSLRIWKFTHKATLFVASSVIDILIVIYINYVFDSYIFICYYILIVDIYLFLKLRVAIYLSFLVCLGIVTYFEPHTIFGKTENMFLGNLVSILILFFFGSAAYLINKEINMKTKIQELYDELKVSKEELEEANRKLTEYAVKIEDAAVLNERNRLAGEIHDTIGHNLTGLIIELDLCGKLIDKDTVKTKVELDKAAQLARHTLAEVRKSVREIMPVIGDGVNGIFAIEELIRDFEKNTKIKVKLKVSEQKYKLSPTVEATLYRTVQEALTNSAKYGQADNIIIQLDYRNSKVELVIKDNGLGCEYITKGIGLKTMEDRINVLGGQISFSTNNGFIINVVIPVEV